MGDGKFFKKAIWLTGGALASLLIMICICFVSAQTDFGRRALAATLSRFLSKTPERHVTIEGLSGFVPFRIELRRVDVADAHGRWLTAADVVLRWSPLDLLHGEFSVDEISAGSLDIERKPVGREEEPGSSFHLQFPEKLPPLVIKKLAVERLSLEQPVFGQRAEFQIEGQLEENAGSTVRHATLRAQRMDEGPETRLSLAATMEEPSRTLRLDGRLEEAQGGLLASVLGIESGAPLQLTLEGKGPLDSWVGELDGSAGSLGSLHSGITLKVDKEVALALNGTYQPPASTIPVKLEPLLGCETHFSVAAQLTPSRTVVLEGGSLWGDGYQLQMTGKINLISQVVSANGVLSIHDLSPLTALAESPVSGVLSIHGALSGTLSQLKGDVGVQLSEWALEGTRIGSAVADLHLEPFTETAASFSGVHVAGSGRVAGLRVEGGAPLPEEDLQWAVDARIPKAGEVSLNAFQVYGDMNTLNISGQIDPNSLSGSIDAIFETRSIGSLTKSIENKLSGNGILKAHLTGDGQTHTASGRIEGRLVDVQGPSPAIAALLGPELAFGGDVSLKAGKELTIPGLVVQSRTFKLGSQLRADLAGKMLKGDWQLSLPDLSPLSSALGNQISGSIAAEGRISGLFSNLECTTSVKATSLILDKRKFQQVSSKLQASGLPAKPRGNFRLEVIQEQNKLDASSNFAVEGKQLKLESLLLNAPGGGIKGNVEIDASSRLVRGTLDGNFKELSGLGSILGEPLEGSAELHAVLSQAKGYQNVEFVLKGKGTTASFGKIRDISLSTQLTDFLQIPRGNFAAEIHEFQGSNFVLHRANLKASGDEKGASFESSLNGHSTEDFDLKARGSLARSRQSGGLQLGLLNGRFGPYPVKLQSPARMEWSSGMLSIDGLRLGFGSGRVGGSARIDRNSTQVHVNFEQLPLDASSSFGGPRLFGSVSGDVVLTGSLSRPSGSLDLKVTDLRSLEPSLKDIPNSTLTASVKIGGGRGSTKVTVTGLTEKPAKLSLNFPVEFSLLPLSFVLPPQGAIDGRLDAEADLRKVFTVILQDDHLVSGHFIGGFDIRGTIASPDITGSASVDNGSYQNLVSGSLATDVTLRIAATGQRLEILSCHGTDGDQGSIRVTGWFELDPANKFPLRLDAVISKAKVIRRDDVTVSASGAVTLAGSIATLTLSGKLDVDSAEAVLPKTMPSKVVKMDVVEINVPTGRKPKVATRRNVNDSHFIFRWDLMVSSPDHVLVRGRGLSSEWRGDIQIKGIGKKPSISGTLKAQRGYFDFLDKRFKLTDGTIDFYGEVPPTPYMQITAEAATKDITARVVLSGMTSSLNVDLQSDPPLPSDEILARVLFNQGVTRLSPLQALKLANAVRIISGHGDTLDILGDTRKFLGLDQLDVREADPTGKSKTSTNGNSNVAVGAGKYLTDDIYVDVEKGVGDNTGKVKVEVDLTPQFSVESEVGLNTGSGVGVNWKYDY